MLQRNEESQQLRPYQRVDTDRMRSILEQRGRCLNLSEMRVGKLVEFIALCYDLRQELVNVLVVAPLSTLRNVQQEFNRWLGWHVHVNDYVLEEWEHSPARTQPVIFAINKEKLRDPKHWVFPAHTSCHYDLILVDEAHHFRSRKSAQTKGLIKLLRGAPRVLFTTGTPLMNGLPRELWPILHTIEPKRWSSFWSYLQGYAAYIPSFAGPMQDESAPWRKGGQKEIQHYLVPYVVRRTYKEVYPELPDKIEQTLPIHLQEWDDEHWQQYQTLAKEWEVALGFEQIGVSTKLALTLRLRQLAASPRNLDTSVGVGGKILALLDYLPNTQGKAVIWCWHRRMAQAIYDALDGNTFLVTGDTAPDTRADICRQFQFADEDDQPLIATIGALKEGIALDTANLAIFMEKSWVPAENEQAAARIMGPNQKGSPLIVSFVCKNTIEDHVERVLQQKQSINSEFLLFQELIKRG